LSPPEFELASRPDRLRIFVSSTIHECAAQRVQAAAAIRSLDQEMFVFEREGARTYGPRALYLGKLRTCHLAIGIYRQSYGWVDEANGLTLSGLEDEYRELERLRIDLLPYVEKDIARDPRLERLIEDVLASRTAHFFAASDNLEPRIRNDILTALAQGFAARAVGANQRAIAPQLTLDTLFRAMPYRVRREGVEEVLRTLSASHRAFWMTGAPGTGKTVALAEHAVASGGAYVNARGLEPRAVLAKAADALLGGAADDASSPATFEEARAAFREAWTDDARWPLLIDDAADVDLIWGELAAMLALHPHGLIGLASRSAPAGFDGEIFELQGFTEADLAQLDALVDADARRNLAALRRRGDATLPLNVRSAIKPLRGASGTGTPVQRRFAQLPANSRDLVALLAMAHGPLALADLVRLRGEDEGGLYDLLAGLDDIVVEDAIGFSILHDIWAAEIQTALAERPQYRAALGGRLIELFSETDRAWHAFAVARDIDPDQAVALAERSLREIFFSGSVRNLTDAQGFLAAYYRRSGYRAALVQILVSLAQMASHAKDEAHCWALLDEAKAVAAEVGDGSLISYVEEFRARYRLQTSVTPDAMAEVQRLRDHYLEDGDAHRAAQLLIDEGVAFMTLNQSAPAIERFRRALDIFTELDDDYGRDVASRNLAAILLSQGGGDAAEGERLLATIQRDGVSAERHRAWLCNTLNKRRRAEGNFAEAEALAREAIGIGERLGDRYVAAINWLALGNTLRDMKRHHDAIAAYGKAGVEAQAISRADIDGRAARLTAACHNELADADGGRKKRSHAEQAVVFARHAIGRLAGSLASYDHADAWDELGIALVHLGEIGEGLEALSQAIALFLHAGEPETVQHLTRRLAHALAERPFDEAMWLILKAHGKTVDIAAPAISLWPEVAILALADVDAEAASAIFALLIKKFQEVTHPKLRRAALDRCLRIIADRRVDAQPGHRSRLLLSLLAYGAKDGLGRADMLRLGALCLEEDRRVRMRTIPEVGLHQIVLLGEQQQYLFTIHTLDNTDQALFIALVLANFLGGFAEAIAADFLAPNTDGSLAIEIVTVGTATMPDYVAAGMTPQFARRPVAFAGLEKHEGEKPMIIAVGRDDVITAMRARDDQVGDFERVALEFLSLVLSSCFGADIQDEQYREPTKRILRQLLW
jgi:tetratricopeptide (TPR) repeat protein